jgi:hypothetical protein
MITFMWRVNYVEPLFHFTLIKAIAKKGTKVRDNIIVWSVVYLSRSGERVGIGVFEELPSRHEKSFNRAPGALEERLRRHRSKCL